MQAWEVAAAELQKKKQSVTILTVGGAINAIVPFEPLEYSNGTGASTADVHFFGSDHPPPPGFLHADWAALLPHSLRAPRSTRCSKKLSATMSLFLENPGLHSSPSTVAILSFGEAGGRQAEPARRSTTTRTQQHTCKAW
jgi:hypothetical protein